MAKLLFVTLAMTAAMSLGAYGATIPSTDTGCLACVRMASIVGMRFAEGRTADEIVKNITSECDSMPNWLQDTCKDFAHQNNMTEFVSAVSTGEGDLIEACQAVDQCKKADLAPAPKHGKFPCVICHIFANFIHVLQTKNQTKQQIHADFALICSKLPKPMRPHCIHETATNLDSLIDAVSAANGNAGLACHNYDQCPTDAVVADGKNLAEVLFAEPDECDSSQCLACKIQGPILEAMLKKGQSPADIEAQLLDQCNELFEPFKSKCLDREKTLVEPLPAALSTNGGDVEQACQTTGNCVKKVDHKLVPLFKVLQNPVDCAWCKAVAALAWFYVKNNKTEEETKAGLTEFCSKLPSDSQVICSSNIQNLDELLTVLNTTNGDVMAACKATQKCAQTAQKEWKVESFVECGVCKSVATVLEVATDNGRTREQIIADVTALCNNLSDIGDLRENCLANIDDLDKLLSALKRNGGDVNKACQSTGKCDQSQTNVSGCGCPIELCCRFSGLNGTTFPRQVLENPKSLKSQLHEKTNRPLDCIWCKAVASLAQAGVESNETKEEIQADLTTFCQRLRKRDTQQLCMNNVADLSKLLLALNNSNGDIAKACHTTRKCRKATQQEKLESNKNTPDCFPCTMIAGITEIALQNHRTKDQIKKLLLDVCSKFPQPMRDTCDNMAQNGLEPLTTALNANGGNAKQACQTAGLCAAAGKKRVKRAASPDKCELCATIAGIAELGIYDGNTVDEVKTALNQVCERLKNDVKPACISDVQNLDALLAAMNATNGDAKKACAVVHQCPQDESTQLQKISKTTSVECPICRAVGIVVKHAMANRKSQQEMVDDATKFCNDGVPDEFKEECRNVVLDLKDLEAALNANGGDIEAACKTTKHCDAEVEELLESTECDVCIAIAALTEDGLETDETEDSVKPVLVQFCNKLPEDLATQCLTDVQNLNEIIAALNSTDGNAKKACRTLHKCPQAESAEIQKLSLNPTSVDCTICTAVGTVVKVAMDAGKTQQEIVDDATTFCNDGVPDELQEACRNMVLDLKDFVAALSTNGGDVKAACKTTKHCNGSIEKPQVESLTKPASTDCAICKAVGAVAKISLAANETKEQIIADATEFCDNGVPAELQEECRDMVLDLNAFLVALAANNGDVAAACKATNHCDERKSIAVSNILYDCPLCKVVAAMANFAVSANKTEEQIVVELTNFSHKIPEDDQPSCLGDVRSLHALLNALNTSNGNVTKACQAIQKCNQAERKREAELANETTETRVTEALAAVDVKPESSYYDCAMCKYVASWAEFMTKTGASKADIVNSLNLYCHTLFMYEDICLSNVNNLDELMDALQTNGGDITKACQTTGYCDSMEKNNKLEFQTLHQNLNARM